MYKNYLTLACKKLVLNQILLAGHANWKP